MASRRRGLTGAGMAGMRSRTRGRDAWRHRSRSSIQIGPGIARIDKEGDSYWVIGTEDGPLSGKKVEIPSDNVAAIQWTLEEPSGSPGRP
jgi:hypothetical protein